jgi:hypothetical protein
MWPEALPSRLAKSRLLNQGMYLIVQHDKREVDPMIEIEYQEDISHTVLITGITEMWTWDRNTTCVKLTL